MRLIPTRIQAAAVASASATGAWDRGAEGLLGAERVVALLGDAGAGAGVGVGVGVGPEPEAKGAGSGTPGKRSFQGRMSRVSFLVGLRTREERRTDIVGVGWWEVGVGFGGFGGV